jgi:hypothetical protein
MPVLLAVSMGRNRRVLGNRSTRWRERSIEVDEHQARVGWHREGSPKSPTEMESEQSMPTT